MTEEELEAKREREAKEFAEWRYNIEERKKQSLEESNRQHLKQREILIKERRFICDAPIGCGKSTALRNWILNTYKTNKYLVIVPTINIAEEFYDKIYEVLNKTLTKTDLYNKYEYRNVFDMLKRKRLDVEKYMNEYKERYVNKDLVPEFVKLCIKDNAFAEFKNAINDEVNIVITTYNTASKCLGTLMEEYYAKHERLDYNLVIDEAHLLLQYISLIEITKEFDNVALITATPEDIINFACFDKYVLIKTENDVRYKRNIKLHPLKYEFDKVMEDVNDLVDEAMNENKYDRIIVKIEDKNKCKLMHERLSKYKTALYTADVKEIELNSEGIFVDKSTKTKSDIDIVVCTSSIQSGQSIKENVLMIFVQTPNDSLSSVKQYIGRNRNKVSDSHLFVKFVKSKTNYKISDNRYKTHYNKLKTMASDTDIRDWFNELRGYGNINIYREKKQDEDDDIEELTSDTREEINDKVDIPLIKSIKDEVKDKIDDEVKDKVDDDKEFYTKKELYKHYNITAQTIPKGFKIDLKYRRENKIKKRIYKLVKET